MNSTPAAPLMVTPLVPSGRWSTHRRGGLVPQDDAFEKASDKEMGLRGVQPLPDDLAVYTEPKYHP